MDFPKAPTLTDSFLPSIPEIVAFIAPPRSRCADTGDPPVIHP